MTGRPGKKHLRTVIFSVCCCAAIIAVFHGNPAQIIKGCIFSQLLILAGSIDRRVQIIPNKICVLTALSGLISFSPLSSLSGAAALFVLLMGFRLAFGGLGGGDIKLFTACGFVLGLIGGLLATLICYSLFCVSSLLLRRNLHQRYPLAPFIAAGSILSYLII